MIELLLKAGADCIILDRFQETPYSIADALEFSETTRLIKLYRQPHQVDWASFTAKGIEYIVERVRENAHDFEQIYRFIASRRQQHQIVNDPYKKVSHRFGCFDDRFRTSANELFSYERTNYFGASKPILEWLSATVMRFKQDPASVSPFLRIRPVEGKCQELDEI